jgi:hypothetical protein
VLIPFAVLGIGSAPCFGVTEALNKIVSSLDSNGSAVLSWSQEHICDSNIPKFLCSAPSPHFCSNVPAGQPSQESIS